LSGSCRRAVELGLLLRGKPCFFFSPGALTRFVPIIPVNSAYGAGAQYPNQGRVPRPQIPHLAHFSG
jgi:hypothetical protein